MGNNSGFMAIVALGVLLMMSRGVTTTAPGGIYRGVSYRTQGLAGLAVAFEENLEENKEEIEDYEKKRRRRSVTAGVAPPIPVLTKAISYRAFLAEKPVRVTTGVYEIR